MRLSHLPGICCLLTIVVGDPATYSLGDLGAYSRSTSSVPSLSGTVLAVMAPSASANAIPSDGIDVYLSDDLKKRVIDAIDTNCDSLTEPKCQQSVVQVLRDRSVDLQVRQIGAIPLLAAGVALFIAVVIPALYKDTKTIPVPIHIPADRLTQVTSASTAAEIAVATGSGSPFVTMTVEPERSTFSGSKPVVMTATDSANGHVAGDVIYSMPPDFADRVQELIVRESQCPRSKKEKKKKRAVDLACVSNAAIGLIVNSQPGAALQDLRALQGAGPQFQAADIAREMDKTVQFAKDFAPALELDPGAAGDLGRMTFGLAFDVLYDDVNLHLKADIILKGARLTSPACRSTTAVDCYASCALTGPVQYCVTDCTKTKTECDPQTYLITTAYARSATAPASAIAAKLTTSAAEPFCQPFQDPHAANPGYCQCKDGKHYVFHSGSDACPYTAPASSKYLVTTTTTSPDPTVPPSSAQPPPSPFASGDQPCMPGWCGAPFCNPECGPAS